MRSIELVLLLVSPVAVFSQVIGSFDPNLPTVQLTGSPWVLARKIHRAGIEDVHPELQGREFYHLNDGVRSPVNVRLVDPNSYDIPGQRVIVYRRVLRPAKLIYTGNDREIAHWTGNLGDSQNAYERNTLASEPAVDNSAPIRRLLRL